MQVAIDPQVMTELNNALFTVSSTRFIRAMNLAAKSDPKKYHHIYEWGNTGNNVKRLFALNREISTSNTLRIGAKFLQSTSQVPIPTALLEPGKSGRTVTSRNIFRDKAAVMESGAGISYQARRTLGFLGRNGGIAFIPAGTVVNILNPGGTQVKGAFEKFFHDWYAINTMTVIQSSGLLGKLQEAITVALNERNAGAEKAKASAIQTLQTFPGGGTE